MSVIALTLWALFLLGAALYTRRARHPDARPLAAYLVFVMVFTVSAFMLYTALTLGLDALGYAQILAEPAVAALFLFLVFIPAFFVARWQLRKPPRQPVRP